MYLRHTIRRKDGKTHKYWQLVRSVRIGKKVRQEIVAQLGELDAKGRLRASELARRLGGHAERPGLFDPPLEKEVVQVRLNGVKLERVRQFGDVWLGCKLWQMAKLDDFFETYLAPGEENIPWATMAKILTVARLCEPSSELHIAEDWLRKTALADILGVDEEKINEDRLYRGLDKVLPLKSALEAHVKKQWEGLFEIKYDLLLYDITSTYFEGKLEQNPQAQRGHSRDHRPDCKQVCIGLVVTRDGMPLGYEIFPGNLHDSKTVKTTVATIESRYGKADRVWVMDRGMVSDEILTWMREGGRRYLVGLPKSELKKHAAELADAKGWKVVRGGVAVRYAQAIPGDESLGGDLLLLCRSDDRRQKEAAMQELFSKRIEEALAKLQRRCQKAARPLSLEKIQRQVGRLLQRNQRAAKSFIIRCQAASDQPSGLRVEWSRDEAERTFKEQSHGCYALRTNVRDWTEEDAWKTYIQLTQVENAFRAHKSELEIRPIWHHREDRVQAHIFVCFLAYVLWKLLEQWQSRAGLGDSPRTIMEELGHIHSGDVVLPTTTGEKIRLRSIVTPEKAQKIILQFGYRLAQAHENPEFGVKM
ncbi:MAG: IS1634 family transposase [Elusimicrobia bacterium]|nr:IS1634 family transposase [Elusimicrobiota bacterium]